MSFTLPSLPQGTTADLSAYETKLPKNSTDAVKFITQRENFTREEMAKLVEQYKLVILAYPSGTLKNEVLPGLDKPGADKPRITFRAKRVVQTKNTAVPHPHFKDKSRISSIKMGLPLNLDF